MVISTYDLTIPNDAFKFTSLSKPRTVLTISSPYESPTLPRRTINKTQQTLKIITRSPKIVQSTILTKKQTTFPWINTLNPSLLNRTILATNSTLVPIIIIPSLSSIRLTTILNTYANVIITNSSSSLV